MDQEALTEAWQRISRTRSSVGELALPSDPSCDLIATAYDDLLEQSLYLQPLDTMRSDIDALPRVYYRTRADARAEFGCWHLRAVGA